MSTCRWVWLLGAAAVTVAGCGDRAVRADASTADATPPCTPSLTGCGGECVDLATDPRHCGQCGHACPGSGFCGRGRCSCTCSSGLSTCPPSSCNCVDLQSSSSNCGACGVACDTSSGFVCVAGRCACAGLNVAECFGRCVHLSTDPMNCGTCGNACGKSCVEPTCSSGTCGMACCPPLTICSGSCIDPQSDSNNCGACGNPCDTASGFACAAGKCACIAGLTSCGGTCVNTQTDVKNCGACGTMCNTGNICMAGKCGCGCPQGQSCCGPICTSLQSDPAHCGACGNACPSGKVCVTGQCSCAAPKTNCAGTCVDLKTDPASCGGCGVACAPGQTCVGGWCTPCPPCPAGQSCCGSACVDTSASLVHCGQCGNTCAAVGANTCAAGACCVHLEAEDSSQVTATPPDGWVTAPGSGMHHSSSSAAAALSFLLKGTRLTVGYFKAPAFGAFQVVIDGDTPVTINASSAGTGAASAVIATSLQDAVHSVVVTCPAQTTCFLDYFTSCDWIP